jgi:hypothetical protein
MMVFHINARLGIKYFPALDSLADSVAASITTRSL